MGAQPASPARQATPALPPLGCSLPGGRARRRSTTRSDFSGSRAPLRLPPRLRPLQLGGRAVGLRRPLRSRGSPPPPPPPPAHPALRRTTWLRSLAVQALGRGVRPAARASKRVTPLAAQGPMSTCLAQPQGRTPRSLRRISRLCTVRQTLVPRSALHSTHLQSDLTPLSTVQVWLDLAASGQVLPRLPLPRRDTPRKLHSEICSIFDFLLHRLEADVKTTASAYRKAGLLIARRIAFFVNRRCTIFLFFKITVNRPPRSWSTCTIMLASR